MDIIVFSDRESWVHRIDPRARLIAALALTVFLSQARDLGVLSAGVLLAIAGLAVARVPLAAILQRLVPLNAFLFFLAAILMFATPGATAFQVGAAVATREGLLHGAAILLKANAIVALLAGLVGTIEFVALGRALGQLRVPAKLVNILLFTVRYVNLMLAEYERLAQAAHLRGFRPGPNAHTLRTTGYLIGMVLVRSYERGARILQAMKLRGYDGSVHWECAAAFERRDKVFLAGVAVAVAALTGVGLA